MKILFRIFIVLCSMLLFSAYGRATMITINNPSFENPVLADDWATFSLPGWSVNMGGGSTNIWNPTFYPLNPLGC